MRRVSLGLALALGAIAAAGCAGGSSAGTTATGAAKGVSGQYYYLAVTAGVGGSVTSGDSVINCSPDGTGCGDAKYHQTKYAWGTEVVLTAHPAAGYAFQQWGGDCSGTTDTCTLSGTSAATDYTVVAVFQDLNAPKPPPDQSAGRVYGYVLGSDGKGASGVAVSLTKAGATSAAATAATSATGAYVLDVAPGSYTIATNVTANYAATSGTVTVPNKGTAACIPSMASGGEAITGCLVRQDLGVTGTKPAAAPAATVTADKPYLAGFGTTVNLTCAASGTTTAPTYAWTQTGGPTQVTLANATSATPSFVTPGITDLVAATAAAAADKTNCPKGPGNVSPNKVGCGVSNFVLEGRPRFVSINRQQSGELVYTFKCTVTDGAATQSGTGTVQLASAVNANLGSTVDSTGKVLFSKAQVPAGTIIVLDDQSRASYSWTITTSTTGAPLPTINGADTANAWFVLPDADAIAAIPPVPPATATTSVAYTVVQNGAVKVASAGALTKAAGGSTATVSLANHGFNTGDQVQVSIAKADAASFASSTQAGYKITVVDANTFTYDDALVAAAAATSTGTATFVDWTTGASLGLTVSSWYGVSTSCSQCHQPTTPGGTVGKNASAPTAQYNEWLGSAHNRIIKDGMASSHYSSACLGCHTLGLDPGVKNGGWDEPAAAAGYKLPDFTFVGAGCDVANPDPSCADLAYKDMPATAQAVSMVQCESCHGPSNRTAHTASLSARACAYCHDSGANGAGKHSLFSQWAQSGHADLQTAKDEGPGRGATQNHCARCHYAQGYLTYVPQLLGGNPGTLTANSGKGVNGITVQSVEPITCQTCHEPHSAGLRLEAPAAPLALAGGYSIQNAGAGTGCASCHNTRNGARNDSTGLTSATGPHEAAQADIYFGQNVFWFGTTPTIAPNIHREAAWFQDTCAECHVKRIPAGYPTLVNHTFKADVACEVCHGSGGTTPDGYPNRGAAVMSANKQKLENLAVKMAQLLDAANTSSPLKFTTTVDAPATPVTVDLTGKTIAAVEPTTIHGQMGFSVTLAGDSNVYPVVIGGFTVVATGQPLIPISTATPGGNFAKAVWNYLLVEYDKSLGIHNPTFVDAVLNTTAANLTSVP